MSESRPQTLGLVPYLYIFGIPQLAINPLIISINESTDKPLIGFTRPTVVVSSPCAWPSYAVHFPRKKNKFWEKVRTLQPQLPFCKSPVVPLRIRQVAAGKTSLSVNGGEPWYLQARSQMVHSCRIPIWTALSSLSLGLKPRNCGICGQEILKAGEILEIALGTELSLLLGSDSSAAGGWMGLRSSGDRPVLGDRHS